MTFRNSSEDYLKSILILKREKGNVRSVDIAKYLGVTKPSVSNAMKKLRKDGLISFDEEGYISFSEEGRKTAENVLSKHILITKILMKIGVSEETASSDACMIEHAISDETYRCLMDYQSKPKAQNVGML